MSAVYFDDNLSGVTVQGNLFINISGRAFLLGGGRDNVFADNVAQHVSGSDAIAHFDNRGGGGSGCVRAGSTLGDGLLAVPYATSAVWVAHFPSLARIMTDDPCEARHNALVRNTYCASSGFVDASNATIAAWGSTAWGNVGVPAPCA